MCVSLKLGSGEHRQPHHVDGPFQGLRNPHAAPHWVERRAREEGRAAAFGAREVHERNAHRNGYLVWRASRLYRGGARVRELGYLQHEKPEKPLRFACKEAVLHELQA